MSVISMKDLLEAGVHFGHQTRRWNPKMERYIFCERNGIYILDLQKTAQNIDKAYHFLKNIASKGGTILFVGTKKQAKSIIQDYAVKSGMYFVNDRWLGGMLTNYETIKKSSNKLAELKNLDTDEQSQKFTKKELSILNKRRLKLERYLGGVAEMHGLPSAIYIVDSKKEDIAIHEAQKLGIPIVAIVDTIANPDGIDYCIPGNDDAIKSIELITKTLAEGIIEGKNTWAKAVAEEEARKAKEEEKKAEEEKAKQKEEKAKADAEKKKSKTASTQKAPENSSPDTETVKKDQTKNNPAEKRTQGESPAPKKEELSQNER